MTWNVSKEIEFDAGHRVPLHGSKCRNPHGHRYKVRATVRGPLQLQGSATGMVVDFGDLKQLLTERVHDVYDHGFIVHEHDELMRAALSAGDDTWKVIVVPWTPTAECMAEAIFRELDAELLQLWPGCSLTSVEVYETPTSIARFDRVG